MPNIYHIWYKGEQETIGNYIFREDTCKCGCIRRTVLNDKDKEEVESYTIKEEVFIQEPPCTRKVNKSRTKHISIHKLNDTEDTRSRGVKKNKRNTKATRRKG